MAGTRPDTRRAAKPLGAAVAAVLLCSLSLASVVAGASGVFSPFLLGHRNGPDWQALFRLWSRASTTAVPGSSPRGLDSLSQQALAAQIDRRTALVESITGRRVCFLRGLQGNDDSPSVRRAARQRHLTVVDRAATAEDSPSRG
jgi:hypothetical protein